MEAGIDQLAADCLAQTTCTTGYQCNFFTHHLHPFSMVLPVCPLQEVSGMLL
jgi:hypothetical protein